MSFKIFSETNADLQAENLDGISIIPMNFTLDGKDYTHYPDFREISVADFYASLKNGGVAQTAQVNIATYIDHFEEELKNGFDILYIGFSSALSGSYQSSVNARLELLEKYPDRKIHCIDTLCASAGQGLLCTMAAQRQKEGMDIDSIAAWLEENKLKVCHWFTVDDLDFLHRGGRVSKTVAVAGGLLKIKPILALTDDGKLASKEKARGRSKSIDALYDHVANEAVDIQNNKVYISHGNCEDVANELADKIRANLKPIEVCIMPIGPSIGAHSGPDTVAVFFLGEKR